ncbi:MAG: hypothetical protein ACJAW1_002406 [Glaciecola sp.]|jgi:hypothetical protein
MMCLLIAALLVKKLLNKQMSHIRQVLLCTANFAGGFAKSYVRGMLEGSVIDGIDMVISASTKPGNSGSGLKNEESTQTTGKNSSESRASEAQDEVDVTRLKNIKPDMSELTACTQDYCTPAGLGMDNEMDPVYSNQLLNGEPKDRVFIT